jgi:glycosyltransferase involved in cell wall biosynthesis
MDNSRAAAISGSTPIRMRIGVFLECSHDNGGAFQQSFSAVEALTHGAVQHEVVVFTPFEETRRLLSEHGIDAVRFQHRGYRLLDRWSSTVVGGAILRRLRRLGLRRLGRHLDAVLDDHGIDLVILNHLDETVRRIGDHPFIITIYDVDHRDHPEFPEAFSDRLFDRVERTHLAVLTRALAVITNSACIARRIADLYQVDPERIIVLPLVPSLPVRRHAAGKGSTTVEEVRRKYHLPDRYVFYPAWFLFHKNHLYLLEGLLELERRHGIVLHAVFCGGDPQGQRARVERQVQALGLRERVQFLGLVPDADIPALYQGAVALVMPSYFGPTNLPPVEAVTLDCPAICSDLPGCREQMGDAALYCDLADPANLADHLRALVQDPALVDRLKHAGRRLAAELAQIDYAERLAPLLDDYAYVRRRWAWPESRTRSVDSVPSTMPRSRM